MTANVKVSHVEMFARPHAPPIPPPRPDLLVLHARRLSVPYYRFLYAQVGQEYSWESRAKMSDTQLGALLADPLDEVHVLHVAGCPAGFVEFDCRTEGDIEIVQFGLTREFIGQGLGRWFLRWAIDHAWDRSPRRLWLHTCTLDHPRALPNYLDAGFVLFKEETKTRETA